MGYLENLGREIKDVREAAEESQRQFGEHFDVTQQAIYHWEKTGRVPDDHWEKLKDRYGIDAREYHIQNLAHAETPAVRSTSMSASNGSTVIKSGGDTFNHSSKKVSKWVPPFKLSELEEKLIVRNREVGNKKMLKLFLAKLDELEEMTSKL